MSLGAHELTSEIKIKTQMRVDKAVSAFQDAGSFGDKLIWLYRLKGFKCQSLVPFYRGLLLDGDTTFHEPALIAIDLRNMGTEVGHEVIEPFVRDPRWVMRVRAGAILYQDGKIGRKEFLALLKDASIPDIDQELTDKYVQYLKRRTLREERKRRDP
jgi:hypothetical protein